jgi:putative sterol carrier protein
MAEFLSDAWVAELDAAARSADDLAVERVLVVEQVVRRTDGRDAAYQVHFGPDGASVTAAGTGRADVVLVTDVDTAWALHQGGLRAQDAFARGALKVRGRPEVLTGRAELLAAFERAVAPVRAGTTPSGAR